MEELNSPQTVTVKTVAQYPDEIRTVFIKKTYSHLAMAIFLFVLIEAIFLNTEWIVGFGLALFEGWLWLLMLFGYFIGTSFAESWAKEATSKSIQYSAFMLYILFEAFIFVPIIYLAIGITGDDSIIRQAGLLTMFLFTGISGSVLLTGANFSFLKTALTVGGIIAIGLIVLGIAFDFSLGLWFSFAMVGVATAAILYQTSKIQNDYHPEQYVAASLGLFGAFMLLLWYIIDILSFFSAD